jgi:hypothetical protein
VELLNLATFNQQLNSKFTIKPAGANAVEVELIEAEDTGSNAMHEQFSITFRGPLGAPLPQGLYPFEHADMGTFELFIVPIKRDQHGMYYEAIFSRVIQPA